MLGQWQAQVLLHTTEVNRRSAAMCVLQNGCCSPSISQIARPAWPNALRSPLGSLSSDFGYGKATGRYEEDPSRMALGRIADGWRS